MRALAPLLCTASLAAQGHFDTSNWQSLFDGETTTGWVTEGGRYDGNARWTVQDGALTGREGPNSAGGLIYTDRYYTNFLFTCDTKITYPFDSGIFLRMVPRRGVGQSEGGKGAQVCLDYRPDGEVGAIYADGFLEHNQDAKELFKRDEWNRVEVRCVGRDYRIQVWLNGDQIMDYQQPEGSQGGDGCTRCNRVLHGIEAVGCEHRRPFFGVRCLGILRVLAWRG